MTTHPGVEATRRALPGRWLAFSAGATTGYHDVRYRPDDVLVFGTERTGLAPQLLADERNHATVTIPMRPRSRSINLANAVSIVVYEAWRQHGFDGAGHSRAPLAVESLADTPPDPS